jgi:hypothetical protein
MSYVRFVIEKHINSYDVQKTGEWNKPEPPPANTFSKDDLHTIGRAIADEIDRHVSERIKLFCREVDMGEDKTVRKILSEFLVSSKPAYYTVDKLN